MGHQKLGDALIGCDHELFNQLPCAVVRLRAQFGDAVAFEFSTGLKGLKIERTRLVASFFEQLREVVLCSELCIHALHAQSGLGQFASVFKPLGDGVIGQLAVVQHMGQIDVVLLNFSLFVEHHVHHHGRSFDAWIEGREMGAELFRQHGENLGRGVHRGGVGQGLLVNGGALFDQTVHISDGDHEREASMGQRATHRQLIKIFGVIVVDAAP